MLRQPLNLLPFRHLLVQVEITITEAKYWERVSDKKAPCHLVEYHLVEYHLVKYHLVKYHLVEYHLVEYHLIEYHLVE